MELKVFKIWNCDEYEIYAANSREQAIEIYCSDTGIDQAELSEDEVAECSLDERIKWEDGETGTVGDVVKTMVRAGATGLGNIQ